MARNLFAEESKGRNLFSRQQLPQQEVIEDKVQVSMPTATHYQNIMQQQPNDFSYQTQKDAPSQAPMEGSLGADIYGAGEAALGVASGVLSSPVAGIAGIGELAVGGDLESATDVIERTRDALTYEPRTEKGQEYQMQVAELLSPIGKAIEVSGDALGEATREATGSWVLGGLAQSIPEAVLELAGVKGAGRIAKPKNLVEPKPKAALSQSAPEIRQLRENASNLYKEIDEAGVTVSKADYQNLGIKLSNIARQAGYDPNLTPKVKAFLTGCNLITKNAS